MAARNPHQTAERPAAPVGADRRTAVPAADRIVSLSVRAAVVVVCAQTALHLANAFLLDRRVWAFEADADGNALSWLASVATFTAALAALAVAVTVPRFRRRAAGLAAVLAFFSLDDVVAIHESLGQHFQDEVLGLPSGAGRALWPVIFFPLLAYAFVVIFQLSREAYPRARFALRLALALFAGAIAAEMAWSAWNLTGGETGAWPDTLQVAVEEGAELAGWLVLAGGLAATAFLAFARSGLRLETNGRRS